MDVCEYILGCKKEEIHSDLVIAPCWLPQSVGICDCKLISSRTCDIWECAIDDKVFTYIVSGVGAASCVDVIMALEETSCNKVLFLGSAGAMHEGINIGDLSVPVGSISADGATRYIGSSLSQDVFGKEYYASSLLHEHLFNYLLKSVEKHSVRVYSGMDISVESILLQYRHMDEIMRFNCHFIDLAVFCISDNIAQNEPLFSVPEEKTSFRKKIRYMTMPGCIKEFLLWKKREE